MTSPQRHVAIWLGGSVGIALFAGLVFGLLFFLLFAAWIVAKWKAWAGIALAGIVLVAFFGPAVVDQTVFDRQLAEIRAQDVTTDPLDLTGRTVLFVGMSGRYHPVECSDLCRNIAAFGGAQAVYFGFDRSLDLRVSGPPLNLLDREIRQFTGPPQDWPVEGAPIERVTPERIDYVVFEGNFRSAALQDEMHPEVSSYGGLFPFDTIFGEYAIYAVDDPTAFDILSAEPLFTRFEVTRHRATVPGLPFVLLGDRTFDHRYASGQSQWNTLNTRDAAAFLCGPPDRRHNGNCRLIQ
ncbi:hypothetical protein [Gymnodinialimonas ulvae]|uniref:hypothetical protein n=1 Tax=Gymnodinialimonas ulvae TaxID=3126504 RepID=UPI0030B1C9F9